VLKDYQEVLVKPDNKGKPVKLELEE